MPSLPLDPTSKIDLQRCLTQYLAVLYSVGAPGAEQFARTGELLSRVRQRQGGSDLVLSDADLELVRKSGFVCPALAEKTA